jgi:hypothetical protein
MMESRNTIMTADRPIEPGVVLRIVERDKDGAMVGFWEGHYSDEYGTIRLYPRANPYCSWRVPRVVHTVDSRLVRVGVNSKFEIRNSKLRNAGADKAESVPRGFWKRPLEGQERMEI